MSAAVRTGSMTGPERAAVFLLALGHERGREVWNQLDENEIRAVSSAMTKLGTIAPVVVEDLLVEFVSKISGVSVTGDFDRTEQLLLRLLSKDRAELIMEEIRGPAGRDIWQKLSNVPDQIIVNYMKNEHPQTVAVILSKLQSAQAARILAELPERQSVEVVNRVLDMGDVPRDAMQRLEFTLRTEFISSLSTKVRHDSYVKMAEVFNQFDSSTEARIMGALQVINPPAAERIRSLMFVFDDLAKLSGTDLQLVIRTVPNEVLARSLKGASEAVRQAIFDGMTERAKRRLMEDISSLGPQRLRDVDRAQQMIVATAESMAAEGRIQLSRTPEDDEMVLL